MQRTHSRLALTAIAACALTFLFFRYGPYFQNGSFDLAQHYMLVDEIMRHGGVRADSFQRMGAMAYYPPASHWMAALLGWVTGSGLVGITLVTVASAFLSYLLIFRLASSGSTIRLAVLFVCFLLLAFTRSQVGWEVVRNFFYPQLVGDVIYFGVLLWLTKARSIVEKAMIFVIAGTLAMWVQPLNAVHIFAAGLMLMAFESAYVWHMKIPLRARFSMLTFAIAILCAVIVVNHPSFKIMREISANNGWLEFRYPHVVLVAIICGLLGLVNMIRRWKGNGGDLDVVLGCAALAGALLVIMQFVVLKEMGAGSEYAVKKHMFLVLTLGVMNVVRFARSSANPFGPLAYDVLSVAAATWMSTLALQGFTQPLAPVVRAFSYANNVVTTNLPPFMPGNTAANNSTLPLMANVMLSLTSFQHPFDQNVIAWQRGANVQRDVKYVMVDRTSAVDRRCPTRWAEGSEFVIVGTDCLSVYPFDGALSFSTGGSGVGYTGAGWNAPESWGMWSDGSQKAEITLLVPRDVLGPLTLDVDATTYISKHHDHQVIDVDVNGTHVATWNFNASSPAGKRGATIAADLIKDGVLKISFTAPGAIAPSQDGDLPDNRILGLGLKTLVLNH